MSNVCDLFKVHSERPQLNSFVYVAGTTNETIFSLIELISKQQESLKKMQQDLEEVRLFFIVRKSNLWLALVPVMKLIFGVLYSAFNPFHTTGLFLYPLKTSGNQMFSDVFRGYRKRPVAWTGLINNFCM